MLLRSLVICVAVSLATAATLTKKNSYGSDPNYGVPSVSSYGAGGGSPPIYDSSSSAVVGGHSSYGGGNSAAAGSAEYANSASASSYGGGNSNYGNSDGYGASSGGTGGGGGNSADSYGNLYYYYYPVTNHTGSGSNAISSYSNAGGYGGGGGGGAGVGMGGYGNSAPSYGGGGGGAYYPLAQMGTYSDPLGGLLSVISSVDINSLILPILLIGGVALLLPAILNCDLELGTCVIPLPAGLAPAAGRRNRRAAEFELQQLSIAEMVQHAYNIYEAVQQSEQCMQRVVCEVGGMMSNVRGKETFFSVMDHFATPYMKKQLRVLKEGALPVPRSSLDASLSQSLSSCDKFACGRLQQLTTTINDGGGLNDNQLEE